MRLLSTALCYLREKPFMTLFQMILMAFGTALITALLLFGHHLQTRFYQDSNNIDAIIGAKGSPLQLVLSTLHNIDIPTGNIPFENAEKITKHPQVKHAIPIALGDHYQGYSLIGTDQSYLTYFKAKFQKGASWNASLQTVLGHDIAQKTGLDIGDYFIAAHGVMGDSHMHENTPYQVVGILEKADNHLDRLILTSLESVWNIHGNADQKEITALFVSYKNRMAAFSFPKMINSQTNMMAASPAVEMARLSKMLGIGEKTLKILGGCFILFAIVAIAISLAQNIKQRQYDLAIFRSLGASAPKLLILIFTEAFVIILMGQIIGMIIGHSLVEFITFDALPMNGFIFVDQIWIVNSIIFAVSLLVCLIPALKVYNTDIAVLLRHD